VKAAQCVEGPDQRDPATYAILGAAFAVHRELGCGFLEGVYRAALSIEFRLRGIPFQNEVGLPIRYKGERLPLGYRVDFTCFESVLVEVKALATIGPIDHAQVINYLHASQYERALLLNFGASSLQYRRLVCTHAP